MRAKAASSDDDGEGLIADAITLNVDNGTKTDAKGNLGNFPLSAGTLAALKQKCECSVFVKLVVALCCRLCRTPHR